MIRTASLLLALLFVPQLAMAQDKCAVELGSNDGMRFSMKNIDVSRSCQNFTITLVHRGRMPKRVMGHNVVITKTEDIKPVDRDGLRAGLKNDFVKPNDARVIAYTKQIGGGETVTLTFPVSRIADGGYSYFCSFPGHAARMKGTLTLVD